MTRDNSADAPQNSDVHANLIAGPETAVLARLALHGNATETSIGFSTPNETWLTGKSDTTYPPKQSWEDLDATNPNAFDTYVLNNTVRIRPLNAGLYRVDFYTWIRAYYYAMLEFSIEKEQSAPYVAYARHDIPAGQDSFFSMTRYIRMTGFEALYIRVAQLNQNGTTRVWPETNTPFEARANSGLYIVKV